VPVLTTLADPGLIPCCRVWLDCVARTISGKRGVDREGLPQVPVAASLVLCIQPADAENARAEIRAVENVLPKSPDHLADTISAQFPAHCFPTLPQDCRHQQHGGNGVAANQNV
jgi:hypothetical protein